MEIRFEDGDVERVGRFDDTRTTYFGRRQKLPVFWIEGERFSLTLANMVRAASVIEDATNLLAVCLDAIDARDRSGIEGAALLLQEQCRKLIGWKEKPKRDVLKRKPMRANL